MSKERQEKIKQITEKKRYLQIANCLLEKISQINSIISIEVVATPQALPSLEKLWNDFNGVDSAPDKILKDNLSAVLTSEWLLSCVKSIGDCNELMIFIGGYGNIPWFCVEVNISENWLAEMWNAMDGRQSRDWIIFCPDTNLVLGITEEEEEYFAYIRRIMPTV